MVLRDNPLMSDEKNEFVSYFLLVHETAAPVAFSSLYLNIFSYIHMCHKLFYVNLQGVPKSNKV